MIFVKAGMVLHGRNYSNKTKKKAKETKKANDNYKGDIYEKFSREGSFGQVLKVLY